ncbi:MAG: hypothetical protein ACFB01_05880 [Cohaesibacteraceae bacterium]
MRQREFIKKAGVEAVVWIDPRKVHYHAGSMHPVAVRKITAMKRQYPKFIVDYTRPFIKAREPFVISHSSINDLPKIEENSRYIKLVDFIEADGNVKETVWYREMVADVKQKGEARYKRVRLRDEDAVLEFLRGYVTALVHSMRINGYDDPNGGYEATGMIDASGSICKTEHGDHRFCIARILGLERFPLKIIGIHEDHFGSGHSPGAATYARALELIRAAGDRFA